MVWTAFARAVDKLRYRGPPYALTEEQIRQAAALLGIELDKVETPP